MIPNTRKENCEFGLFHYPTNPHHYVSFNVSAGIASEILRFCLSSFKTPLCIAPVSHIYTCLYIYLFLYIHNSLLCPLSKYAKVSECQLKSQTQGNGFSMISARFNEVKTTLGEH